MCRSISDIKDNKVIGYGPIRPMVTSIIMVLMAAPYAYSGVSLDEYRRQVWMRPVEMHRTGVSTFFSEVFNMHGFGSYSCGPLVDFLRFSCQTKDPLAFTLRIMDLFHVRMKEATWLNPYDVYRVLCTLHDDIAPLVRTALDMRCIEAEKALYKALLTGFRDLKHNPQSFIHDVVVDILAIADSSEVYRLRTLCISMVGSMLDKLIWSPADQEDVWRSVNDLAEVLYDLHTANLIPDSPTLNHCLWSLLYRFSYLIENMGEELSPATYAIMKRDLIEGNSILFSFPDDREGLMNSRAQWLRTVIIAGEVRAREAREGSWIAPMN